MPFLVLHVVHSFLRDLAHVFTRSDQDQALELVLLRQQLRLYEPCWPRNPSVLRHHRS